MPLPVATAIVMPGLARDGVVVQDVLSVVKACVAVHYPSRRYLQLEEKFNIELTTAQHQRELF